MQSKSHCEVYQAKQCKICGSHIDVAEILSILGCNTV